jgi:hypothetical protein
MWTTGTWVKSVDKFSYSNFADKRERSGKGWKLEKRATKFLASLQAMKDEKWQKILDGAQEVLPEPGSKKRRSSSVAMDEASDAVDIESEPDFVMTSDIEE